LAMDIQRHLNSEAVLARPPSTAYRFGKVIRRNKRGLAAAAAIALALIAGAVVSISSLLRERLVRERAVAAEREQARLSALEAQLRIQAGQLRKQAEIEKGHVHQLNLLSGERL